MLEDFCGKVEVFGDDRNEVEWLLMFVDEVCVFVIELMIIRLKMFLYMVFVDILLRLLYILDY